MRISEHSLIRLARRINNPRRSYLLVNPLQAKHMPVSPRQALELSRRLGCRIREVCPDPGLVIGFAETATAVAAGAVSVLGSDPWYLQTTREFARMADQSGHWIEFTEDHSHARSQALFSAGVSGALAAGRTTVLIDDEISTGRTCLNLVRSLRREHPGWRGRIVLASFVGRCGAGDIELLRAEGAEPVSLLEPAAADYGAQMAETAVEPAALPRSAPVGGFHLDEADALPDPRFGVQAQEYLDAVDRFCAVCGPGVAAAIPAGDSVLVLGTEECMYPAIRLAACLEEKGLAVSTHATTRSPIGISAAEGYPIRSGYRLRSFYEPDRETYLYNPKPYQAVIVVTDAYGNVEPAMKDVERIFRPLGAETFLLLRV